MLMYFLCFRARDIVVMQSVTKFRVFQVLSIVDEFVFAREGAAKGSGGLNKIYERRVD